MAVLLIPAPVKHTGCSEVLDYENRFQLPVSFCRLARRFSEPGDVEKAFQLVLASDGLQQTKVLARQATQEHADMLESLL